MKINDVHKAVREGDLRRLKEMLEKKKLVLARDRKGATPLHNAILYEQTDVVRYLAQTFPQTLNAPDYVSIDFFVICIQSRPCILAEQAYSASLCRRLP